MFDDRSTLRRVSREGVLIAGGGRALLMQIAHPQVAAGVAAHSSYRAHRLRRLTGTLRPVYAMVFGSTEQARAAAAGVNAAHEEVVGPGYRATDPELLMWVLATLIDTALMMHARFVGPLTPAAEARYYREMCTLGAALGIPEHTPPPDLAAFRAYVVSTVDSLEVTDAARAIAADLTRPLHRFDPVIWLGTQLTAGLLPPRLRREYGLGWGRGRAAALLVGERASRALLPLLPAALRAPPALLLPPGHTARAVRR